MRVHLLDPPAYSPAYDDALAAALGRAGADVRLLTSPYAYGEAPTDPAYGRVERFYRRAVGPAGSRRRTLSKLAGHVPDMLDYRRSVRAGAEDRPDVAHFQWLTIPRLDLRLLPGDLPTVLTIHDPLERGSSARLPALFRKTCGATPSARIAVAAFDHVAAVVVHSAYAREQVIAQHGLEPGRVHVIRHGALPYRPAGEMLSPAGDMLSPAGEMLRPAEEMLRPTEEMLRPTEESFYQPTGEKVASPATFSPVEGRSATVWPARQPSAAIPRELNDDGRPVVLCFGLLRPYKGVETLLAAWRGISGGQLWIVGRPMMDLTALRAAAPAGVQIVPRFASRGEEEALFERADIIVLPYERSDRFGFSGVLATALGYGKAIVLSDVGGLADVARPDPDDAAAPPGVQPPPEPALQPPPAPPGVQLPAEPPTRPPTQPPAQLVPPGDADALHAALSELLADPPARERLAAAAAHAAATTYSWDRIARQTLDLYARIIAR